jgi:hypothetical protein
MQWVAAVGGGSNLGSFNLTVGGSNQKVGIVFRY